MTQERKDQLYDEMFGWICEHIKNDEDLFLTLHGHFGMTKDELHDHSIESLDRFFPEESARSRLKQKVNANFSEYKERWLRMSPAELIERCEELEAVTRMAKDFLLPCRRKNRSICFAFIIRWRWSATSGSAETVSTRSL
jgi:hypothetical protein